MHQIARQAMNVETDEFFSVRKVSVQGLGLTWRVRWLEVVSGYW